MCISAERAARGYDSIVQVLFAGPWSRRWLVSPGVLASHSVNCACACACEIIHIAAGSGNRSMWRKLPLLLLYFFHRVLSAFTCLSRSVILFNQTQQSYERVAA